MTDPIDDMPDQLTVNGHLFVHVGACPCPRIQAEVARLAEGRSLAQRRGFSADCDDPRHPFDGADCEDR